MLKIIVYEDNPVCLEKAISAVHKAMGASNIDYRIGKYLGYNEELAKEVKDDIHKKIYILDIELPEVSGLELAEKIRENDWNSIIIFVTSHPECKNDIFYSRLMAFDYISKYSSYDKRLQQSVEKAVKIIDKKRVLSYKFNHILYRIELEDILYIEKVLNSKKCIIYTESGYEYEIGGTMKEILEKLDESFVLTHKSCIININKIKNVDIQNGIITLTNGEVIEKLAHRQKKKFEISFFKR